jgi:hypothetical protein
MTDTQTGQRSFLQRCISVSLRWQICVFTGLAILSSLIVMGWLAFSKAETILTDVTLDKMAVSTSAAVHRISQVMTDTRIDVLQTPEFPPIPVSSAVKTTTEWTRNSRVRIPQTGSAG